VKKRLFVGLDALYSKKSLKNKENEVVFSGQSFVNV
jgi:hypothetical protein